MEKELQDEVLKGLDIFESYALTNVFKIPDNAVLSQVRAHYIHSNNSVN